MMRANEEEQEVKKALVIAERLGLKLVSDREYSLGQNAIHRRILVLQKYKNTKIHLPRRPGMAVKKPLT